MGGKVLHKTKFPFSASVVSGMFFIKHVIFVDCLLMWAVKQALAKITSRHVVSCNETTCNACLAYAYSDWLIQ